MRYPNLPTIPGEITEATNPGRAIDATHTPGGLNAARSRLLLPLYNSQLVKYVCSGQLLSPFLFQAIFSLLFLCMLLSSSSFSLLRLAFFCLLQCKLTRAPVLAFILFKGNLFPFSLWSLESFPAYISTPHTWSTSTWKCWTHHSSCPT